MLSITALCGLERSDTGIVASSVLLRDTRSVTVWVDPSSAFLGRMSATISDGVGWCESVEIDLDCECIGCGYLDALRTCVQRVWQLQRYDLLVLQLAPSVEPDGVLESLCATLDPEQARLDTVVGILRTGEWLDDLAGGDMLGERGLGINAEDDRPVSTMIASQVGASDLIVLAGGIPTDTELAALAALAPSTPLLQDPDLLSLPMTTLARTRRHQPRCLAAFEGDGLLDWSSTEPPHASGLQIVRWSATRPLHAERLYDALEPISEDVIRSAGRIVIASTVDRWTRWESAGGSMSLGDLGPRAVVAAPHSRLTFLGPGLDAARITGLLDMCLLTDTELAAGPQAWQSYDDPFAVDLPDEEGS